MTLNVRAFAPLIHLMNLPKELTMRLMLALFALLAFSGCTLRAVTYRERPVYAETTVSTCADGYACTNTYYWDEWREVYVYYDGYRYHDCTGLAGAYSPPPYGVSYYAVPYGYRPYGYRPGWNLGLYFGRPYESYGYGDPSYAYGPSAGYGYYSVVPGRAYGAVRIVVAPRDA